jgi:hypothetical protein
MVRQNAKYSDFSFDFSLFYFISAIRDDLNSKRSALPFGLISFADYAEASLA